MSEDPRRSPEAQDLIELPVDASLKGCFLGSPTTLLPAPGGQQEKKAAICFYDLEAQELKVMIGGFPWFSQLLMLKRSNPPESWSFELSPAEIRGAQTMKISALELLSEGERERLAALPLFDLSGLPGAAPR